MNRRHVLYALLALLSVSALSLALPARAAEPTLEIVSAEFGLFDASTPNEIAFEPSQVVPHQEGQRYGWVIELRTNRRSVAVREEYLLPSAIKPTEAGTATDSPNTPSRIDIPLPRRNQVSQRQLVPVGGRIYGEWAIGPGEPVGKRHLQVIVEGQVAADFDYEVK
jgi:hypothetical protein